MLHQLRRAEALEASELLQGTSTRRGHYSRGPSRVPNCPGSRSWADSRRHPSLPATRAGTNANSAHEPEKSGRRTRPVLSFAAASGPAPSEPDHKGGISVMKIVRFSHNGQSPRLGCFLGN